jgi:hypothetical protein
MTHSPDKEPRPNQYPLPRVSEEICAGIGAEIIAEPSYLKDSLVIMHDENPELTERLSIFVKEAAGEDTSKGQELIMAAIMVYRSLRAQAEADEMNVRFDTPPSE